MMDYLVEFLEVGARVIKDPSLIEAKLNQDNVLLNPEIKHLAGISPSFWVREGDTISHIGLEASKEAVFSGKAFASFSDSIVMPEPIALNIVKLESMVKSYDAQIKDIDAKRISSVQGFHDKMSGHMDATVKSLAEFDEKLEAMQGFYERKLLLTQVTYFICLLGMFLLKFL
jgi:hypothetical protein